jgi:hypothetical protein
MQGRETKTDQVRYLLSAFIQSLIFLCVPPLSVQSQCFKSNTTFGDGEYISYEVSYSFGPIWVDAGLVTFSATKELYNGKESLHLKSTGKTYPSYDLFFKVRDYYDSWIDPNTFQTYEFRRYIYEGSYTLLNTLRFDPDNKRIYSNTKRNNDKVKSDSILLDQCTYDMLSAVYFTRTLDRSKFENENTVPIRVFIDDGFYSISIRSRGKEVIENSDGKKYRCIKFSAKMVRGTIFKGDEDVLVWVTDDENKVPVLIEAKILVGTIKAYLKEAKGLRNPTNSLIK